MGKLIDLTGQVFTRLTVKYLARAEHCKTWWMCICSCGTSKEVRSDSLLNSSIRSCGCLNREIITKHGLRYTAEYQAYLGAKARCTNSRHKQWKDYGGRGIKFKFLSVEEFWAELGKKPYPSYVLDRIENDGNYERGNVRWATCKVSMNNRRVPKRITHCKRGHKFVPGSYSITKSSGGRDCFACQRLRKGR